MLKMYLSFCLLLLIFSLVTSDYGSANENKRRAKFLSFGTGDDDLKIDLEFSIPFLSIPVKKLVNSFGGAVQGFPPINVNLAALVLGGILIISSSIILPLILKHKASHYDHRFSRVLESAEFGDESLLGIADQILRESQDWTGCPLKLACWTGKKLYDEEAMKIWYPIISNPLLSSFVNGSSINEAISSGRRGVECGKYSPCKLNEEQLSILWKNIGVLINS